MMAYLRDLTDYCYLPGAERSGTKAIGWLGQDHPFATSPPSAEMLDRLWQFCQVSVAQTRGVHPCPFCDAIDANEAEREGKLLLLGTAEIRVFSRAGAIYAASTLLFHYVAVHHYDPPEEFLKALFEGPCPPSEEYFERLDALGLAWEPTPVASGLYWDPRDQRPEDDDVPIIELMTRAKAKRDSERSINPFGRIRGA